jgi:GNAT superfamily N-acetyltransferase
MIRGKSDLIVGAATTRFRAEALDLVFSYLPPNERLRQIREAGHPLSSPNVDPFEGLIGAWRAGRLVSAMFSQILPGRAAMVFLPRFDGGEPTTTAVALYAATWTYLAKHRVILAQVLLPKANPDDVTMARMGGFEHTANLTYLVSLTTHFPTITPVAEFQLQGYSAMHENDWIEVVHRTHESTWDCPGLHDPRTAREILAECREHGMVDTSLSLLVWHEGRAAGCLLLADHPRHNNMELRYLGLLPHVRGRGWGRQLARHAQWQTRRAGRRRLVVAVDAENLPALQTYAAVDFQAWGHRQLCVRRLPSANNRLDPSEQVFHGGRTRMTTKLTGGEIAS